MIPKPVILDISEWQVPNQINYDQLAKQINGVIVRVQYGSNYVDNYYQTHIREFQKRGIPTAVYAWVRGTSYHNMEQEALDFYTRAKAFQPVFWWLDVEEQSMSDMRGGCERYRAKLKQLGAKKVGVYVANHLYGRFNLDVTKFDGLWVPTYGQNNGQYTGANPTATTAYHIHQYTSSGKLPGYNGHLDLNRLAKGEWAFFFGKTAQSKSSNQFELSTAVYLRQAASEKATAIALLKKGERVQVESIQIAEGYVWGQQKRKDGHFGYLALGEMIPYGKYI